MDYNICQKVNEVIEGVIKDFIINPFIFLTESDLQSYLYMKLLEKINNMDACSTDNDQEWKSYRVHTEIVLAKEGSVPEKLIFKGSERCDIILFKKESLIINNDDICLKKDASNKGYIAVPEIIIEIKLRRNNKTTHESYLSQITKDVEKLKVIKERSFETYGGKIFRNTHMFVFALDQNSKGIEENINILQCNPENRYIKIYYKHKMQQESLFNL